MSQESKNPQITKTSGMKSAHSRVPRRNGLLKSRELNVLHIFTQLELRCESAALFLIYVDLFSRGLAHVQSQPG